MIKTFFQTAFVIESTYVDAAIYSVDSSIPRDSTFLAEYSKVTLKFHLRGFVRVGTIEIMKTIR